MTRGWRRSRGGFTLMETAVTIGLIGVIAVVGYMAFATLIDQRSRIRAAMAETERAAALRATLEDWFARGYLAGPSTVSNGLQMSSGVGGLSNDVFGFVTRAPTPSLAWATVMLLFIDNIPSTPERGLTLGYLGYYLGEGAPWVRYSDMSTPQPANPDPRLRRIALRPLPYELDSTIVGMRVEYLDQRTHRWYSAREGASIQPVGGVARITLEGAPNAPLPRLLQLPFIVSHEDQGAQ